MDELSEDERKALRGSKFAPLPSLPAPSQPRLAHPGGAIKTNKAAALAKFLERKLQDPQGLASLNPDLIERAVKNAKHSITSGGTSSSGRTIKHVDSFDDPNDIIVGDEEMENDESKASKKTKKKKKDKKKKKKNKKRKVMIDDDTGAAAVKKPKKKLAL